MEVITELLLLHVIIKAETQVGIYRLTCSQIWCTKMSWDMEHEHILLMGLTK